MKNIEDFIKENPEVFDTEEPRDGHFERFQSKLGHSKQFRIKKIAYKSMKYAAAVIVLVSLFVVYNQYSSKDKTVIGTNIYVDEFTQATSYYNSLVEKKIEELEMLSCSNGETEKFTIKEDMIDLNNSHSELQSELSKNPENEQVKNAIINNYQMRIDFLDMVIGKLKNYC